MTLQERECPIRPENTIEIGLTKLASGSLNRIIRLIANRISSETAWLACNRLVNVLFFNRVTSMKSSTEAQHVEYKMWQQFGIEGLCVGKDRVNFSLRWLQDPRSRI